MAFAPDEREMYPVPQQIQVMPPQVAGALEGEFRPGHFQGVCTVVAKLFNIVRPRVAIFGKKDYQQLAVIRRMVVDLDMGIDIVGVPTVRESDGLAMSSRNVYLDADERERAATLYRVLRTAARDLAGGAATTDVIVRGKAELTKAGFDPIDYLEVVDADTLQAVPRAVATTRIAVAAWLGKTRLIDNVAV